MEECEVELTRVEEQSRKLARHREQLEGRQLDMKEVDVKEQQLLRQLANAEDKLARVRRTAVSKREAAQKKMQTIREEYNIMAQERAMRMQEMDKKKAMIEQTEKKVLTCETRAHIDCRLTDEYRSRNPGCPVGILQTQSTYRTVHGGNSIG